MRKTKIVTLLTGVSCPNKVTVRSEVGARQFKEQHAAGEKEDSAVDVEVVLEGRCVAFGFGVPFKRRGALAGPSVEEGARLLETELAEIVIQVESFHTEFSRLAPLAAVASGPKVARVFGKPWHFKSFGCGLPSV